MGVAFGHGFYHGTYQTGSMFSLKQDFSLFAAFIQNLQAEC